MATTIRRIRKLVQKIAKKSEMDPAQTRLAQDCVVGICKKESCKVSDIARTVASKSNFKETARCFYDGLSAPDSNLDRPRLSWLREIARTADKMPFIAVDPSDIIKLHGKDFDFLDIVRDASDRDKRKGPGFHTIQIEATDEKHRNLPLWHEVFSTVHPDYRGWFETIGWAMLKVLAHTGKRATWLFDRGFDAGDFYTILLGLGIKWVVRQLQTRNVIIGKDKTVIMRDLAESLDKPHMVLVPYVCKKTHEVKHWPLRFGYAPVRLPGIPGRFFMVAITGLRDEDMVLLTNEDIKTVKQAGRIVQGYMRRWGIAVTSKGRTTQSVKVRPRLKRLRPRSLGGAVAGNQDGEALRQSASKGGEQRPRLQRTVNAEVASLHANPVAETVDNARRQYGPAETGLIRRSTPAGYQRRHGAKGCTETGETLGVRRRNPAEEARPITVSGKWKGWHQGVGSGHGTVDLRAAKRAGRDGPGPADTPFVEARQG